jgi:hypothetical protein
MAGKKSSTKKGNKFYEQISIDQPVDMPTTHQTI